MYCITRERRREKAERERAEKERQAEGESAHARERELCITRAQHSSSAEVFGHTYSNMRTHKAV